MAWPHAERHSAAVYAATTALVGISEVVFSWVLAPFMMLCLLSLASLAEAWTAFRCCGADEDTFDFGAVAKKKLELTALSIAAMCLDGALWVLGEVVPEKFPLLTEVKVPFLCIVWTAWLIAAELRRTSKNVAKRGRDYALPFAGGALELAQKLRAADEADAGGEPPRRRKADQIVDQVVAAAATAPPPTPPQT